jgi:hypothetical protein
VIAECHVCGAPQVITTMSRNERGEPTEGISHCAEDPSHTVGEPYLTRLRLVLGW